MRIRSWTVSVSGERVVSEHGEALQILGEHDPDADAPGR